MWRSRPDPFGPAKPSLPPPHKHSDGVQQLQNGVIWLETHAVIAGDARLLESIAHHLYIRCGIAVGRGDPCMPEPGLDRQKVHAGLEKLHGEGVPEDVRRYGLVGQSRSGRPGARCGRRGISVAARDGRSRARSTRMSAPAAGSLAMGTTRSLRPLPRSSTCGCGRSN